MARLFCPEAALEDSDTARVVGHHVLPACVFETPRLSEFSSLRKPPSAPRPGSSTPDQRHPAFHQNAVKSPAFSDQ